jgi:subtilase family serine protease
MNREKNIVKIIDKLVKRKIVLYNPNIQNKGIAKKIDNIIVVIFKSSNKTISSSRKQYASQVHRIHREKSVITAIDFFVKRFREVIFFVKSLI